MGFDFNLNRAEGALLSSVGGGVAGYWLSGLSKAVREYQSLARTAETTMDWKAANKAAPASAAARGLGVVGGVLVGLLLNIGYNYFRDQQSKN
jgi:membrane protein YqaA with SNARE-associated domain